MVTGKVIALTFFDFSAAFNSKDHTVLLRKPDDRFGVTGKALDWFEYFLTGRCQKIKLRDYLSSKADLTLEVLQG